MEARFYEKKEGDKVRCHVCPHNCIIASGKCGICRTRCNNAGTLELPFYGRLSAQAVDPIEKKPLYHFYPGSTIFSVGFWGCSFRCPFCQNYRISQSTFESEYVSPEDLCKEAMANRSFGIAYTYSEPLIHMEYLIETASIARKMGLKNVLVSNGYVNSEPAGELLPLLDAANIDLKAFNPEFYNKEIGGDVEDVKRFISEAAKLIHLEVTTLVIPTKNSSETEIESIAGFLASIDKDMPFHLSCYFPTYKYAIPQTPVDMISNLSRIAGKYLRFVYVGNTGLKKSDTICPSCGNILISRSGYATEIKDLKAGLCGKCGEKITVIGIK
jgi:pyruvate formate lyase activating enzyme